MKKSYKSGVMVSLIAAASLMVAASAQAYSHTGVTLRDHTGAAINAEASALGTCANDGVTVCNTADDQATLDGVCGVASAVCDPDSFSVPAVAPAFSVKQTCAAGTCHDYDAIERHSFHAQLGANQHMGWNAWASGNWNSIATKGKPWVQSPGHVGKW